ncbi:MAG TPA: methylated DNA-protein cysteine methyltransferase [Ruminococcaceae bacterium]|nr:methylated DNA-protein cysteine methyltransferase [Oscillospiraceae bacterium]
MPKVETLTDPKAIARYGGSRMLLAPPLAYDALMKTVPYGRLITTDRLRERLAKDHGADFTCPLTCGIFVNVAAQASAERAGADETPWWRTLKKGGELNEKYPDGIAGQKLLLEMEGHTVIQKGKRYFVKDYEQKLFALE